MATTEQDRAVGPTTGVVRIDHWIGGRRIATKSGRSGPVYNPASGRKVAEVGFADPQRSTSPCGRRVRRSRLA